MLASSKPTLYLCPIYSDAHQFHHAPLQLLLLMSDHSLLKHSPFLRFPCPMPPQSNQSETHQPLAVEIERTLFFHFLDESYFTVVIERRQGPWQLWEGVMCLSFPGLISRGVMRKVGILYSLEVSSSDGSCSLMSKVAKDTLQIGSRLESNHWFRNQLLVLCYSKPSKLGIKPLPLIYFLLCHSSDVLQIPL